MKPDELQALRLMAYAVKCSPKYHWWRHEVANAEAIIRANGAEPMTYEEARALDKLEPLSDD